MAKDEVKVLTGDERPPIETEVEGIETVEFKVTVRGKEFNLEAPADLMDASAEVMEHYQNEKILPALRALLGEVQYRKLIAAGMTSRDALEKVMPAYNEAIGVGED